VHQIDTGRLNCSVLPVFKIILQKLSKNTDWAGNGTSASNVTRFKILAQPHQRVKRDINSAGWLEI